MKVRNRLVTFRVTDEELRRLKTASALRNARCFSEFVRSVILEPDCEPDHALALSGSGAGLQHSFDRRLAQLESAVARLVDSLKTVDMFEVKSQQ